MRLSISEAANLSGVSVRTLHYYHEIGLLSPSETSETGYRFYDERELERLQQILFYRELDFPLKEISRILNATDYKKEEALQKQNELLLLKRKRLDKLIRLLQDNMKGAGTMSFEEFDMEEIDQIREKYKDEVQEKWGKTDAFAQSNKKTGAYTKEDWKSVKNKSDKIMQKFAQKVGSNPADSDIQHLVKEWQDFITDSYYDCTNEILAGLGKMYIADERFTENMDKFGTGTARLMSEAIDIYCRNKN